MNMEKTVCKEVVDAYECRTGIEEGGVKKTIVVRYACCHGYQRSKGEPACSKVTMKSLEETVMEQGGEEFLAMVKEVGLLSKLQENMTVFVPTNEAVEEFHRNLMEFNTLELESPEKNEVIYNVDDGLSYDYRKKREVVISEAPSLQDNLLSHLTSGFVSVQQMQDEGLLATEGSTGGQIRTTVYRTQPEKVVMANCARITAKDILATNGVVHVVDKMIQPARNSLGQILTDDFGFAKFSKALKANGLLPLLDDPTGHFTVFAPTDEALGKLDKRTREQLLSGDGCGGTILKSHILPNVLCSGVVQGRARTNNLLGDLVLLERDNKNTLSVEGVELIMSDIMATNGVIHVVNDVIIPSAAKRLSDVLKQRKLTKLLTMLESAKLVEELEGLTNVTIFLPSLEAFSQLPEPFIEMLAVEPANLLEFMLRHVGSPMTPTASLTNGLLLESEVREQNLRVNEFELQSSLFGGRREDLVRTAQCANLVGGEEPICGGVVFTLDRVLLPNPPTILGLVEGKQEFSRFLQLLEFAGMSEEVGEDAEKDGQTLLVPTNAAFEKLPEDVNGRLLADQPFAQKVVQSHILDEVLCCSGIAKNNVFFNRSRRRAAAGQVSVSVEIRINHW
jgi:transforming growth factor-beta-induced protein